MILQIKYCSNCGQSVSRRTPDGDTHERWVCDSCGLIHYQNPIPVVGCVPERDGKILLCKRAIEPRYGYWTVPAGFLAAGASTGGRNSWGTGAATPGTMRSCAALAGLS